MIAAFRPDDNGALGAGGLDGGSNGDVGGGGGGGSGVGGGGEEGGGVGGVGEEGGDGTLGGEAAQAGSGEVHAEGREAVEIGHEKALVCAEHSYAPSTATHWLWVSQQSESEVLSAESEVGIVPLRELACR